MEDKIVEYIKTELLGEDTEEHIEVSDDLLGSGILDSLGMMKLIQFVEEEFGISVSPEEMTVENFMTVGHISEFISKK